MTPKKARWLMRRPWYVRWRMRKIKRQWGYWDEMLMEALTPSVGECTRQMERLVKKSQWYEKHYCTPHSGRDGGATKSSTPRRKADE